MGWPTHPDGTNKTMGEMSPEERREQMAAAVERYNARNKAVEYECIGFATGCIGKDGLKPDIVYVAKGGKLVEA